MPQMTIQQISPLVNPGLIFHAAKLSRPQFLIPIRGHRTVLPMPTHAAPAATAPAPEWRVLPDCEIFANFVSRGYVRQFKIE
jgi:hypothetical protein